MRAIKGKIENGRVVIDEREGLPEGASVIIAVHDPAETGGVEVDAETLAMLDERIAEADRGELVDGAEVIRRLREHEYSEVR